MKAMELQFEAKVYCLIRKFRQSSFDASLCIIVAILLICVCPGFGTVKAEEKQVANTVTEADNGTTVEMHVGDAIVLRLPENATTGYRWAIEALNGDLVEAQEGQYISQSGAVGGGGEATWTLYPKAPGTAEIKLKLWRPFEGERSVQRNFGVTLKILPP
jgi:inhibitor of cysteine peptidase